METAFADAVLYGRLALAETRLVAAKLLWHFDMELDGPHETWVDDARFYVSLERNQLCPWM